MNQMRPTPGEKLLLAVDIGSNAMRASLACLDQSGDLEVLNTLRFPLRLGSEVFQHRNISLDKMKQTIDAFQRLKDAYQMYQLHDVAVVATSAIREAQNGMELVRQVKQQTGFDIEIISGEREAHYIYLAVAATKELASCTALLIDIGGGSTELTLTYKNKIVQTKSYPCGTVRLLQATRDLQQEKLLKEVFAEMKMDFEDKLAQFQLDFCIGTGGNLRRIGKLRKAFFQRTNLKVHASELDIIMAKIEALTLQQRISVLDMREDRADVILPACKLVKGILDNFKTRELHLPKVGLKEGLLLNMLNSQPRNIYFS